MAVVGIIGLGKLGFPIGRNLILRGHRVIGFRRGAMDEFREAGGVPATSIQAVAKEAEVLITCLPSADALREVLISPDGLLPVLGPRQAVFDLTSASIAIKKELDAQYRSLGRALFDCTVSGNPRYLADRTATIFVSGDRDIYDAWRGVLADITDNVPFVGTFGAGTTMKAIVTALVPVHTMAAAEALALATRAGIDRQVAFDAIAGTTASSAMFETRGRAMIDGSHSTHVTMKDYLQNVRLTEDVMRSIGGDYPLFRAMAEAYRACVDAGYGTVDHSVIFDYLLNEKRG